jgi:hypothetical protein
MSEPYKVRIKIGDAEFEAEGEKATVDAQFAVFMAAMSAQPAAKPSAATPATPPADNGGNGDEGNGAPEPSQDGVLDAALLRKAFSNAKDMVSLNALPKSTTKESDTLLMLLYGFAELKGQDMVLGTQLIRAARQSGITLERVDRAISKYESLLLKGGQRKGQRYGLNNQGKKRAKEMITELLSA